MEDAEEVLWIVPCWRDWEDCGFGSSQVDPALAGRAYQHWHLADELSRSKNQNEITRGTVVQKLWNAVDARVRLLNDEYRLRQLSRAAAWPGRPDTLAILTQLGLVRPSALRQLKDIRNSVEHQDRGAPAIETCRSFVDTVWYFLRSTDIFVGSRITDFELEDPWASDEGEPNHFVSFALDFQSWLPHIDGWLPAAAVSPTKLEAALSIKLDEPAQSQGGAVWVRGTVRDGGTALEAVTHKYFLVNLPDGTRQIE
ncbi:hypothetical protein [Promicromonospora sp. NFX87]|uniref:hypothetical protein n=1 Tax=Promicromonospora sp. NFX87 TaxID=3402691 RepID=UPI003AFA7875